MRLALVFLLLATGLARAGEAAPPPGERPVKVDVGFYLLNLTSVDERTESFNADIYILFRWHDPRLEHGGKDPQFFAGNGVGEKLEEIWSPQIEFVNTGQPEITNQNLGIFPDGTVLYAMGLTSNFRADLDLRRFPFDRQRLVVRVRSFVYQIADVVMEPDHEKIGFEPESSFEGLRVKAVSAESVRKTEGWGGDYSEFRAHIDVERGTGFYFWTVFGPVILIFVISCSAFLVSPAEFSARIGICLTALLACIATQFALSFSLPQIDYLTLIDRLFVITHVFILLAALILSAESLLVGGDARHRAHVSRLTGLAVLAGYLGLLATAMVV